MISIPWVFPLRWLTLQIISYCCCCSVAKLCLTFCMPGSMRGFPVLPCLPEFAQTHVHGVGDAIQLSHPLLSPSPPALNLSQHQGLFQWVSSSHQVAQVLEFQLPVASVLLINVQCWFLLGWTGWISLPAKGLSRVFSNTTIQKRQFFGTQLSLWSISHMRASGRQKCW